MIAERRMGKSKLIDYCFSAKEVENGYFTFYIDLLHTTSLQEFVYEFGNEVFKQLQKASDTLLSKFILALKSLRTNFEYDPISGKPQFSISLGEIEKPEITLSEIFSTLSAAPKRCIVAFDEFQQITSYPEKNIEALLRSYIQRADNANFIFAGSERHIISQMFLSAAHPFYNSTNLINLHAIPLDKYTQFVISCMSMMNKTIDADDIKYVYTLVDGNTYCMQKIFHEALYATPDAICTHNILCKTITNIIDDFKDIYQRTLSGLTLRQKEVIYAIASDGKATKILSTDFIKKHTLSTASSVQAAVRKLSELNLITTDGESYVVTDQFFRLYLTQKN